MPLGSRRISMNGQASPKPKDGINAIGTIHVLVLNAGSSSLKFGLFEVISRNETQQLACGIVERIGQEWGSVRYQVRKAEETVTDGEFKTHEDALHHVIKMLTDQKTGVVADPGEIKCVGHRVVHGGNKFKTAAVIDDVVEKAIDEACTLAPLHNPPNLMGIRVARSIFNVPQVAVFDTAFHMTMKPENFTYALPRELAEKHGLRRYGFHGTSYSYAAKKAGEMLGRPLQDMNIIACHLGSGCSMACIKEGECIDTTMGMTPLEGLVMSSRSGDIDAGVLLHLAKSEGMSVSDLSDLLNKKSGLKGLCGYPDMRSINLAIRDGDPHARLAKQVFVARVRKYLGSYLVQLGGKLDALVFTGGIGENDAATRQEVCAGLSRLGIEIDEDKNNSAAASSRSAGCAYIDSSFSRVNIIVVTANEEGEIALQSVDIAKLLPEEQRSTGMKVSKGASKGCVGRIYLAPLSEGVGATTAAIGIVGVLLGAGKLDPTRLAPFFPFEEDDSPFEKSADEDPVVEITRSVMQAESISHDELTGMKITQAYALINEGRDSEVLDRIIEKYQGLCKNRELDFVLAVGHPTVGMSWHKKVAAALGMQLVVVGSLSEDVKPSLAKERVLKLLSPIDPSVKVKGVIMNRLPADCDRVELAASLQKRHFPPLGLIPYSRALSEVSATEVAIALGATIRYGTKAMERVPMRSLIVATLHLEQLLVKLREKGPGAMIVVHSGRGDVILGVLSAIQARGFPAVSGIILTGGANLDPAVESVMASIEAGEGVPLPIMSVKDDTFKAASDIVNMRRKLAASGTSKVEQAISVFEKFSDKEVLYGLVTEADEREDLPVTPHLFEFQLKATARARRQRIVLPEGSDARVVTAASELLYRGLCKVTILGDPDTVSKLAQRLQVNISKATVIDPSNYADIEEMALDLAERRKAKGMTYDAALRELRTNPNMFGTVMMARGMADGMVSGACHTTADTMRPALQVIKCAPGTKLVSSVFFMLLDSGVKVFADCAIMESPDSEELAIIAAASANTARAFGIKPRVAMLSYATGNSNTGPMITKVREATEIVKRDYPDIKDFVDGPIQFDAAVDPEVAAVKYKGNLGPVAGQANVCIFPDLNAGNNAYKAVQQASGCVAIGPVMQGLKMPVNDLSRGCTVEDIVQTVVVTCVQAIAAKGATPPGSPSAIKKNNLTHLLRGVDSYASMEHHAVQPLPLPASNGVSVTHA